MDYFIHVIVLIAFYSLLAQSLNLFTGNTGLISLVHAGFYGLGGYSYALLSAQGVSWVVSIPVSFVIVGFAGLVLSVVAFRTRDDYFVIITLALQMLIFNIFNNLSEVTNGPIGIRNIPGLPLSGTPLGALSLALGCAAAAYLLLWRLTNSAWVSNLRAIRDDDIMMRSLGKRVGVIKTMTFVLSATIAGLAGVLFAQYVSYIDPTSFTISESIVILSIVIIGGLGSMHGSFLAAILMIGLPEALRFVGISGIADANARQILYGVVLVAIMLLRSRSVGN